MDLSLYDYITLFLIVPILLFKFTQIPTWIFEKVRRINPVLRNVLIGILLIIVCSIVVANSSQGMSIRFGALTLAILVCLIHYTYNSKYNDEEKEQ